MKFHVVAFPENPRFEGKNVCLLVDDQWDDFGYRTLYHLYYLNADGHRRTIGAVKIYKRAGEKGRTTLKSTFSRLGKTYVSLGDSQKFYENLIALGQETAQEILEALRDAAWDTQIFREFEGEDGVQTSLLRGISTLDRHKFAAIAHERAVLSPYDFTYSLDGMVSALHFKVVPDSLPPTNIHAIIGRNGVGKTRLLRKLIDRLCNGDDALEDSGSVEFRMLESEEYEHDGSFANVVNVAFSAFDEIDLPNERKKRSGLPLAYIGLRRPRIQSKRQSTTSSPHSQTSRQRTQLKSIPELTREFVASLTSCLAGSQKGRWIDAVKILGSDPIFSAMNLGRLAEHPEEDLDQKAKTLFKRASAGHKIVLVMSNEIGRAGVRKDPRTY